MTCSIAETLRVFAAAARATPRPVAPKDPAPAPLTIDLDPSEWTVVTASSRAMCVFGRPA